MTTLTWTTEADRLSKSGRRYVMRSPAFPKHHFSPLCADDRVAVAAYMKPRTWRASFYLGYDSIWFEAGTANAAIKLLEKELDRRSIGLFGTDEVTFIAAE